MVNSFSLCISLCISINIYTDVVHNLSIDIDYVAKLKRCNIRYFETLWSNSAQNTKLENICSTCMY